MQVVGDFYLTNITDDFVLVPKTLVLAYGRRWAVLPFSRKVDGMVLVQHPEENIFGSYHLVPNLATRARADWWIEPPILKPGELLRGRACFIDQYGNEHWTKMMTWRYS